MTDVKDFKDLLDEVYPQESRKRRNSKQEALQDFASYIHSLQNANKPFQVVFKSSHDPLCLSVIDTESELLLRIFTLYDTTLDEAMSKIEGVYFYAY